jgi:thioredoxin-like negative regulator of GroEL
MVHSINGESLTRALANHRGGAKVVVVYSSNYGPSVQLLAHVRKLVESSPSIEIIPINFDEQKYLVQLPILNVNEIPTVLLFNNGRPFCSPVTDFFQVTDRIRRLAVVSMDMDDFDSIGTNIRVPDNSETQKWKNKSSIAAQGVSYSSFMNPLYTIMDSLFDI